MCLQQCWCVFMGGVLRCMHLCILCVSAHAHKNINVCINPCVCVCVLVFVCVCDRLLIIQFGDSLLHFTALHQQSQVASYLVKERGVSVNDRNAVCVHDWGTHSFTEL